MPLLALLKHPLTACGMAPAATRMLARRLESAVLRGPRPAPGVAGLGAALGDHAEPSAFVAGIGAALAPLSAALAARETTLERLVAAHLAARRGRSPAATADTGAERLWREEAGEAAAHMASELDRRRGRIPAARRR